MGMTFTWTKASALAALPLESAWACAVPETSPKSNATNKGVKLLSLPQMERIVFFMWKGTPSDEDLFPLISLTRARRESLLFLRALRGKQPPRESLFPFLAFALITDSRVKNFASLARQDRNDS